MEGSVVIARPRRWDNPFSWEMSEAELDRILATEPFDGMEEASFPPSAPLRDIIRNDTRIGRFGHGDIIVRAGDYGNSAFLIMSGKVRVALAPGLPEAVLGRAEAPRIGVAEALRRSFFGPRLPEIRESPRPGGPSEGTGKRGEGEQARIFLQDVPRVLDQHRTAVLGPGDTFGEIAALGRTPRTATVFADGEAQLLEIRWQGLRDIRRWSDDFRDYVDRLYRERSLESHLRETELLRHLGDEVIESIGEQTLFETYGEFDWFASYPRLAKGDHEERLALEPIIVQEGDYPDGLLLVRAGFVRMSKRVNHGHKTVRYLGRGDVFGFDEIAHNWRYDDRVEMQHSFRALGYTDILRVPTAVVEEHVLPTIPADLMPPRVVIEPTMPGLDAAGRPASEIDPGLVEFLVEHRFVNGTATMLIDLDRCVRCDACVVACAAGHQNNPRFNRHGQRYGHYMVANACMHCADPVCMIGCPTGAIHRSFQGGEVVINDDTCIGCATCANSCPYDNIRMVEIRQAGGDFIREKGTHSTILKATKCDLCVDLPGGPACQRACPHDALARIDLRDLPALARRLRT